MALKITFNEDDDKIIKRAEEIVGYNETDYYTIEDLLGIIDELVFEIHRLEEKIEDREQDIEDNYRRIDVAEQYDISDNMFH